MKQYDYIFTGTGLSALMTVYEMVLSEKFSGASILLLDENPKKTNDRTWCFWDVERAFASTVSIKWDHALFANSEFSRNLELKPYQYKMIRGLDFYQFIFDAISKHAKIDFSNEKVLDFVDLGHQCEVKTEGEIYSCKKVLNSIFDPELVKKQSKYPLLQQHFVGWFIKSKEEVFLEKTATFMDFSVEQKEYESEIEKYIQKLGISDYEIIEKEQGNIPMTSYQFWKKNSKNILHIGSVGGWTKASTGYTFKNAIKKSKALVGLLSTETDFTKTYKRDKFWFYDVLFLDVLFRKNELGSKVFSALFRKGNPTLIFKFLDEETSFWEDIQVIWKCPKGLFVRALLGRVFRF
jgi:lycopene beta-cyclase